MPREQKQLFRRNKKHFSQFLTKVNIGNAMKLLELYPTVENMFDLFKKRHLKMF